MEEDLRLTLSFSHKKKGDSPTTYADLGRDGVEIPGPVDWSSASHWIEYDDAQQTVQTWCKTGPGYQYALMTKIRPMRGSEVIHSKLRGHTREEVLKAYGVEETPPQPSLSVRDSLWKKLFNL